MVLLTSQRQLLEKVLETTAFSQGYPAIDGGRAWHARMDMCCPYPIIPKSQALGPLPLFLPHVTGRYRP